MTLNDLIPDADVLLDLDPEELAAVVLKYLVDCEQNDSGKLNRYNFGLFHTFRDYPPENHEAIGRALMEAWMWLEREGMLAPKPGDHDNWFFVTRRGQRLAEAPNPVQYLRSHLLPKSVLHPQIAQKVSSLFVRGEFDTAVFQGFKEVEVAVRDACGFPPELIGTTLMRRAFDSENGPLTDMSLPIAEREAMAHLFAGAVGLYKNPHSHRLVQLEAEETTSLLIFATHLLFIVDRRKNEIHT